MKVPNENEQDEEKPKIIKLKNVHRVFATKDLKSALMITVII